MVSKIEIANMSLDRIGDYPIQSFTENSKAARVIDSIYDITVDQVLEDHRWGHAEKMLALSLLDETYSGYTYAYQYPVDCVKFREIYDPSGDYSATTYDATTGTYRQTGSVRFKIISNSTNTAKIILTDKQNAEGIYTMRATNTAMMPTKFIDALVLRIASKIAITLKQDSTLKRETLQEYAAVLYSAESDDSNEGFEKPDDSSSFREARL